MFWKIGYLVKEVFEKKGPFNSVLDVGSRDINGTVKGFILEAAAPFPARIVGIDMIGGDNVDVVMNGHDLMERFEPESFDLVTCCEMIEHDNAFWITVENMRKIVKPGGYLMITAPGINFFKHDFPHDYFRFTEEAFSHVFFKGWEDVFVENHHDDKSQYSNGPNTILGYARKPK